MPPPMVQGVELTKVHQLGDQQVHALDDVTLEVYAGELVAVAGKPGSGKSTLLHILGCLQRPDSGAVRLEGLDVTQLDEEELAQVRQSTSYRRSSSAKPLSCFQPYSTY